MAQILFNTFKVPNCYLVRAAEMSLAATGRTTGIVVESGEGVTQVLPVFEGFSIPHAIKKTNFAGRELTKQLQRELSSVDLGLAVSQTDLLSTPGLVKSVKERLCYVTSKSGQKSYHTDQHYTLPDSTVIRIPETLRISIPELMFQSPRNFGKSIHERTWQSIDDSDEEYRKDLLENIILSGGNTKFEGFPERLQEEIAGLAPSNY